MTMGYGTVRSLEETMSLLRLVPGGKSGTQRLDESQAAAARNRLNEGRTSTKPLDESGSSEKEKLEKKRVIEEARRKRAAEGSAPKKSSLDLILEDIQQLEREINSTERSGAMQEVEESLDHIKQFSSKVLKRYEWREDEKSRVVTELFKGIREEAVKQTDELQQKQVSEDNASSSSKKLVMKYVEALSFVKDQFRLNETAYSELKKWAESEK